MYNALTVANTFLELAEKEDKPLTNMQLQKLVYIAEGFSLAMLDESLIHNSIHAFQWGPVIPKLYDAIKYYGKNPIPSRIIDPSGEKSINLDDNNDTQITIVKGVWAQYSKLTAAQLSAITHKPDTPWSITWASKPYSEIPRDLIKNHYRGIIEKRSK